MAQILIRQNGETCELWLDAEIIAAGGRVAIKKEARRLAQETGQLLFNVKKDGSVVYLGPNRPSAHLVARLGN